MSHPWQAEEGLAARAALLSAAVALLLLSSGCAFVMHDKIHYVAEPATLSAAACRTESDAVPGDRMVGIALSGGGSRAAVFGAAALEALAEHGVLEQITHVSSVSGGSLPAGYLATNPPSCWGAVTREAQQSCWRDYFAGFKSSMRTNYETQMMLRNARPTRFSSPTRMALSLQESLDKQFMGARTFGAVEASPVMMINATSYDETRRFVFSNACFVEGVPASENGRQDGEARRYEIMAGKALAGRTARALTFSRPGCPRSPPHDLPVSLAVVASAAFPPAIGPVAFEVPSACDGGDPEWWHLGDGGVVENSGTDSLEEVLLRRLVRNEPPGRTLFLAVDSGMDPRSEDLKRLDNFKMNTTPDRVNLIVRTPRARGQVFREIFWEELVEDLAKHGIGFEKLTFRHSEAQLDARPVSCAKKKIAVESIGDHLRGIPTRFKVDDCDADLLEMAAHQLVHATLDDVALRRLAEDGYAFHAAQSCALRL